MTPGEMLKAADEIDAKAERLRSTIAHMRQKYPWGRWLFDFAMVLVVRGKARAAEMRREARGEFRF